MMERPEMVTGGHIDGEVFLSLEDRERTGGRV
jgi:hypothetical protein